MASVSLGACVFSKSGSTIQANVTFHATFTETETRLDIGFQPELVVKASLESTQGVVVGDGIIFGRDGKSMGMGSYLEDCRREIGVPLPMLKPSGQRSVSVTHPVAINADDLFDRPNVSAKWTTPNAGLEVLRLNLYIDLGTATVGGPADPQRFVPAGAIAPAAPLAVIDTTDDRQGYITARGEIGSEESKEKVFDDQTDSKWLDLSPDGTWIAYFYAPGIAGRLTSYTLTSANDCPERDPAEWQLQGSNDDGVSWTTVDSQMGVAFGGRHEKRTFAVSGAPTYKAYRLNITKVWDRSNANSVQLAEMELLGQRVRA
jgi:hypothetical protein